MLLFSRTLTLRIANLQSVPPASNSRLSPLPPEPADFGYDHGATVDIPIDSSTVG